MNNKFDTSTWMFNVNDKVVPGKDLSLLQRFIACEHTLDKVTPNIALMRELVYLNYDRLLDMIQKLGLPYDVQDLFMKMVSTETSYFMRDYLQEQLAIEESGIQPEIE